MGKRYSVPIRNVRKPAIRKMSPMLKRYKVIAFATGGFERFKPL